MSDFGHAFTFMGDNSHLMLTKIVEHLELSAAAIGVSLVDRAAARRLAGAHPPRLVHRGERGQHRASPAQPRGDRDRARRPRPRLHQRDGRPGGARRAADPHQRLRGGGRGGPGGGGGRPRHGHAPVAGALAGGAAARAAADLRRHPHRRRVRGRHRHARRASPAGEGSATSSSTRPTTACPGCWRGRICVPRWRSRPRGCWRWSSGPSRRAGCAWREDRGWPSGGGARLRTERDIDHTHHKEWTRMRRLVLAVAVAGLTLAVAACGGGAAAPAPAADRRGRHHAGRREQARHGQARGHARRQELHRGVRARAALQAGARGEGLHGEPEVEHRLPRS